RLRGRGVRPGYRRDQGHRRHREGPQRRLSALLHDRARGVDCAYSIRWSSNSTKLLDCNFTARLPGQSRIGEPVMVLFEWTLTLLLAAVLLAGLARRLEVPYPALLALAGAGLAFLPFAPEIAIDPELALALFVAPV